MVRIGIGTCRIPSIVLICGPCGVENYMVVLIEIMNEDYEQWKLFCLVPSVRYYGSIMGIEVFWPYEYLSMNNEKVVTARDQCHMIVDGVNNFSKKQVSCKDNSLVESFRVENIRDVDNMGNRVEDLCNEELRGEMVYISEDGVEGPLGNLGPIP